VLQRYRVFFAVRVVFFFAVLAVLALADRAGFALAVAVFAFVDLAGFAFALVDFAGRAFAAAVFAFVDFAGRAFAVVAFALVDFAGFALAVAVFALVDFAGFALPAFALVDLAGAAFALPAFALVDFTGFAAGFAFVFFAAVLFATITRTPPWGMKRHQTFEKQLVSRCHWKRLRLIETNRSIQTLPCASPMTTLYGSCVKTVKRKSHQRADFRRNSMTQTLQQHTPREPN
jgi:hypothetical protein